MEHHHKVSMRSFVLWFSYVCALPKFVTHSVISATTEHRPPILESRPLVHAWKLHHVDFTAIQGILCPA